MARTNQSKSAFPSAGWPAKLPAVKRSALGRIIFVTGTDTGVGKTLLTGLLLASLRQRGCHALAIKPFCSGGLGDVKLLRALQPNELAAAELNPFYYPEPVAPLVSARLHRRPVALEEVVDHVRRMAARCQVLLVEGAGGLLVPLGEGYSIADVIRALNCEVILVARNRLGTVNHTLLTLRALETMPCKQPAGVAPTRQARGASPAPRPVAVVLMGAARRDLSCASNAALLEEFLPPTPLINVPFLGAGWGAGGGRKQLEKKFQKALAHEKNIRILCDLVLCDRQSARPKKTKKSF